MELDQAVAENLGDELQADTEFLVLHCDASRLSLTARLHDGNRQLATGQKRRRVPVAGKNVRLGKSLRISALLLELEESEQVSRPEIREHREKSDVGNDNVSFLVESIVRFEYSGTDASP